MVVGVPLMSTIIDPGKTEIVNIPSTLTPDASDDLTAASKPEIAV